MCQTKKLKGGYLMAFYMYQVAYTPESLASQTRNLENVVNRTKALIESLGGKLVCTYYSFGEYDILQIIEYPDNVSAASHAIVVASGGAVKASKITPLMTVEEGSEAFLKAVAARYAPPV